MAWIVEHSTDWTATARTNNPAVTPITTLDGGAWTPVDGTVWYTEGGGVISIAVTNGGSGYTTPPTVVIGVANGSGVRAINATATATISGGVVTAVTMTNMGRDYITVPAVSFTGGGGSGATATASLAPTPAITLQSAAGALSYTGHGAQGWLYRAAPSVEQRIVQTFYLTATTDVPICVVRLNPATKQLYTLECNFSAATPKGTGYYLNNYPTNSSTIKLNANFTGVTSVVGHLYSIEFIASGSNPTTLSATLTDVTAGITSATITATGSELGVQTANNIGVGISFLLQSISSTTLYEPNGVLASPLQVVENVSAQTITLTGAATSWDGSTVFTITNSGGATASKVSQNVTGATAATIVVNTGSTAGSFSISDGSAAPPAVVTVVSITAPAVSIATSSINPTGCTIAASTYATNGSAPYQYQVYRSPNSNFSWNDGSATLIHTQTGVGDTVVPTAYIDTTAPTGASFYQWVVTDSNNQIVYGAQAGVYVPVLTTGQFGCIGDSITVGHDGTKVIQWLIMLGINAAGSGQTDGTYDLIFSGGLGTGAAGKVLIQGGKCLYAWITNPGYGYTSETTGSPTVTYSGAGGTPGTVTALNSDTVIYDPPAATGGGYPLCAQKVLQQNYGFKNARPIIAAHTGSQSSNWMPHGSVLISNATNASPIVITTASAHGLTNGSRYVINTVQGNTAANGNWYVNVLTSTTFSIYQDSGLSVPVVGNGAYIATTGTVIGPGATTGVLGYQYEIAVASFGSATTTPYVHILFGPNEASAGKTPAQYQQTMTALVYALTQAGYTCIISYPLYWVGGTAAQNLLLQQYQGSINNITNQFPGQAFLGMTNLYGLSLNYPELLVDALHPNDTGYAIMGGALAKVMAPYLQIRSGVTVLLDTGESIFVLPNQKSGIRLT